jgi:hypothetical protein
MEARSNMKGVQDLRQKMNEKIFEMLPKDKKKIARLR